MEALSPTKQLPVVLVGGSKSSARVPDDTKAAICAPVRSKSYEFVQGKLIRLVRIQNVERCVVCGCVS